MANYITSFSSTTAYDEAKDGLDYPNVSLIENDSSLVYEKSYDFSKDCFTIVSEADNNTISLKKQAQSSPNVKISASTDGGKTWAEFSTTSSHGTSGTSIATLNAGGKLLIKGVNDAWGSNAFSTGIDGTNVYHVQGNIMSLLFGDNFIGQTSLSGKNYAFKGLLANQANLTNAENLILPATTLAHSCYHQIFYYSSNLASAPELPATTLVDECYRRMFYGCTNLNYIKCLATDISAAWCTESWLNKVSSTGTFVKNASMSSWTTGSSGIPSGWTVQDASA